MTITQSILWQELPQDVAKKICSYLKLEDAVQACQVSKAFYKLIEEVSLAPFEGQPYPPLTLSQARARKAVWLKWCASTLAIKKISEGQIGWVKVLRNLEYPSFTVTTVLWDSQGEKTEIWSSNAPLPTGKTDSSTSPGWITENRPECNQLLIDDQSEQVAFMKKFIYQGKPCVVASAYYGRDQSVSAYVLSHDDEGWSGRELCHKRMIEEQVACDIRIAHFNSQQVQLILFCPRYLYTASPEGSIEDSAIGLPNWHEINDVQVFYVGFAPRLVVVSKRPDRTCEIAVTVFIWEKSWRQEFQGLYALERLLPVSKANVHFILAGQQLECLVEAYCNYHVVVQPENERYNVWRIAPTEDRSFSGRVSCLAHVDASQ